MKFLVEYYAVEYYAVEYYRVSVLKLYISWLVSSSTEFKLSSD